MKLPHALLALAFCTGAQAELFTGNDLNNNLKDNVSVAARASARAYIAGVYDSHSGGLFCTPAGVSLGQLSDVVKRHLEANPRALRLSAAELVVYAFQSVWPCPAKQN